MVMLQKGITERRELLRISRQPETANGLVRRAYIAPIINRLIGAIRDIEATRFKKVHRSTVIGHPVRHFHAASCMVVGCSSRTWAGVLFAWCSISQWLL
jgi:hypothetical protein